MDKTDSFGEKNLPDRLDVGVQVYGERFSWIRLAGEKTKKWKRHASPNFNSIGTLVKSRLEKKKQIFFLWVISTIFVGYLKM